VTVETFREPATAGTQAMAFGLAEALAAIADDDRDVFLLEEIGGLGYAETAPQYRGVARMRQHAQAGS